MEGLVQAALAIPLAPLSLRILRRHQAHDHPGAEREKGDEYAPEHDEEQRDEDQDNPDRIPGDLHRFS
jgi:hypothetical protein